MLEEPEPVSASVIVVPRSPSREEIQKIKDMERIAREESQKEKEKERLIAREKAIANLKKFETEQAARAQRAFEREEADMKQFRQKELELEKAALRALAEKGNMKLREENGYDTDNDDDLYHTESERDRFIIYYCQDYFVYYLFFPVKTFFLLACVCLRICLLLIHCSI